MNDRPSARLYVKQDLAKGADVSIAPAQAHYLKNVLRLNAGSVVALFNGRDGEWLASIDQLGKGRGSLAVTSCSREQSAEGDIWLVFAPVKRARLDFLVQKASELGATAILPVRTEHTIVARLNVERLRANVMEAAEQTGRLTLPRVEDMRPLSELLLDWPPERRLVVCAESGPATPIAELFSNADPTGPWAVLIGPEGGFTKSELDQLSNLPFVSAAGLGPRLLRADTAAIAALACWQAVLGDWQKRPPVR
jgi:16S rRNA (uracil1498-N3)-methyltransferase